jgi:hypothetical protein
MKGQLLPFGNRMLIPHIRRFSSSGATGSTTATAAAVQFHVTRLGTCAPANVDIVIEPLAVGVVEMVTAGEDQLCGAHIDPLAVQPVKLTSVAMAGGGPPDCQRIEPVCGHAEYKLMSNRKMPID